MYPTVTLNIFCKLCGQQQKKIQDTPDPKFCGYCGKLLDEVSK